MNTTKERSFACVLWTLALLGTSLDQISKYSVFKRLYDGHTLQGESEVFPGVFKLLTQYERAVGGRLTTVGLLGKLRTSGTDVIPKVNHGALFGLGGQFTNMANILFASVSIFAAGAIISWSFRRSTSRDRLLCISLGLILAGTMGNLYDRLVFDGVRDFLYFYWIEWPVFNFADCCLVCGAFLLLAQAIFTQPVPLEATPAQTSSAVEVAPSK